MRERVVDYRNKRETSTGKGKYETKGKSRGRETSRRKKSEDKNAVKGKANDDIKG